MKIFIFEQVDELTDSYHSNGALAVVAKDLERALELARAPSQGEWDPGFVLTLTTDEIKKVITYDLDPSKEYEEKVFIFPDSGCC